MTDDSDELYDTIKEVIEDPRTAGFLFATLGPNNLEYEQDAITLSSKQKPEYENTVRLTAAILHGEMCRVEALDVNKDLSDFISDVIDEVKEAEYES